MTVVAITGPSLQVQASIHGIIADSFDADTQCETQQLYAQPASQAANWQANLEFDVGTSFGYYVSGASSRSLAQIEGVN
ncbi:hypothetical protein ST47_g6803 [Ascochyta rabiei]|uniref:Uncharacterized protein n=1 Tax=Didymella rabiei TaxID=5454 RepID=A0A163BXI5_DIDRA|nr:hypothetical protein ST47_g6803 [Ascochyta rabiei]